MILKLKEVYRSRSLSRGNTDGPTWLTRDVFVNTKHIVLIRENVDMKNMLIEGKIQGLKGKQDFCTISLDRGQAEPRSQWSLPWSSLKIMLSLKGEHY